MLICLLDHLLHLAIPQPPPTQNIPIGTRPFLLPSAIPPPPCSPPAFADLVNGPPLTHAAPLEVPARLYAQALETDFLSVPIYTVISELHYLWF